MAKPNNFLEVNFLTGLEKVLSLLQPPKRNSQYKNYPNPPTNILKYLFESGSTSITTFIKMVGVLYENYLDLKWNVHCTLMVVEFCMMNRVVTLFQIQIVGRSLI